MMHKTVEMIKDILSLSRDKKYLYIYIKFTKKIYVSRSFLQKYLNPTSE